MGDMSEYRGLITIATFIGIFVLILAIYPAEFIEASKSRTINPPDELFEAFDVYSYAETMTLNLNDTAPPLYLNPHFLHWNFDFGGHALSFVYVAPNDTSYNYGFYLVHVFYEWWIFPADHSMTFYRLDGESLGTDVLLTQLESNQEVLRAKCSHLTVDVGFAYNSTLYSSFTDAYDHNGVYALFGIQFDQVNTSYNAMNIVGSLLFFSLPNETPSILGAIIAIPLWACIVYLIFIFILRTIGAVFGGGGA